MIKRLVFVGGFTGFSHLVSLLTLSLIAKTITSDEVGVIGIIESNLLLLVQVIAFGLQVSATRDIALTSSVSKLYADTQVARLSLSIVFIPIGVVLYLIDPDPRNLMFLSAPIVALNGDYALYGKGYPVFGAFLAFIRVMMPSLALVLAAYYFREHLYLTYVISLSVGYAVSGMLTARKLKVSYFYVPNFSKIGLYLKNFNLGLSNFALYIIGPGIVYIGGYFFSEDEVGLFFSSFKYYIVFKGLRRILVQSFYQNLIKDEIVFKVDMIAILAAFLFAIPTIIYPETFIKILFNQEYMNARASWIILGLAAICSSFTTSAGTRILLNKDDRSYVYNFGIASIVTVVTVILLSWFSTQNSILAIAILVGEVVLAVMNARKVGIKNYFKDRLKFSLFPLLLVAIVSLVRFVILPEGEEMLALVVSIVVYATLVSVKYLKQFV